MSWLARSLRVIRIVPRFMPLAAIVKAFFSTISHGYYACGSERVKQTITSERDFCLRSKESTAPLMIMNDAVVLLYLIVHQPTRLNPVALQGLERLERRTNRSG
jgi:hypothetical protein